MTQKDVCRSRCYIWLTHHSSGSFKVLLVSRWHPCNLRNPGSNQEGELQRIPHKALFDEAISHHHHHHPLSNQCFVSRSSTKACSMRPGGHHQGEIYIQLRFQLIFLLICFTLRDVSLSLNQFFFVWSFVLPQLAYVHFFPLVFVCKHQGKFHG